METWSIIRVVKAGSRDLLRLLQKSRSEMKLMQSKVISVGLEGRRNWRLASLKYAGQAGKSGRNGC